MHIPIFFNERFERIGFEPNLRSFIIAEHSAPNRHYHGLGHIARMVREIEDKNRPRAAETFERELLTAAFFHDIVYDVHASDNEEQSAVTAKLWLDADRHDLDLDLVQDLILATKDHDVNDFSMNNLKRYFIKTDLSILWSEPPVYEWYARGIRKEYNHVGNDAYREGRATIIRRLLHDLTPSVFLKITNGVNRNVAWELEHLERGTFDVA